MTHRVIAIVAGGVFAGLAAAQPTVYMYTSSGTLLTGRLGSDSYTAVGSGFSGLPGVPSNNIMGLETDDDGRVFANFTFGLPPVGTQNLGAIVGEINTLTGETDFQYALSDDPNFAGPGSPFGEFGGAMAKDTNGDFWMLNWNFGALGPVYLHQFDVDTGAVVGKIETELGGTLMSSMAFRDDGTLVTIDHENSRLTVIDSTTGLTISSTVLAGMQNTTDLAMHDGQAYLATQYGDMYSLDLDTYEYTLLSSFGTDYGTTWGLTVVPTPGTLVPVLAGLGFIARRRRG